MQLLSKGFRCNWKVQVQGARNMIVIWSSLVRCLRWCTMPSPVGCLTKDNGAKKSPLLVHVLNDMSSSGSSSHKSLEKITQSEEKSAWNCAALETTRTAECMEEKTGSGTQGYQESISDTPTHHLLCHLIQTLSVNVQLTLAPPVTLSPYKRPLSASCIATGGPLTIWPFDRWRVCWDDQYIDFIPQISIWPE